MIRGHALWVGTSRVDGLINHFAWCLSCVHLFQKGRERSASPFFSLLVFTFESFHLVVALDTFVMWNTTLTSRDCDAISIPAISRSLPCHLRGAHSFLVSVTTATRFLAVVLIGSQRYHMTPMYYFSKRRALAVASFPDDSTRGFLLTCNL